MIISTHLTDFQYQASQLRYILTDGGIHDVFPCCHFYKFVTFRNKNYDFFAILGFKILCCLTSGKSHMPLHLEVYTLLLSLELSFNMNVLCCLQGTFPEPLQPATNSIVCTKNTALLREIFNQTYTSEKPIKFPSRKCRPSISRCHQCLNQLRCKMIGMCQNILDFARCLFCLSCIELCVKA